MRRTLSFSLILAASLGFAADYTFEPLVEAGNGKVTVKLASGEAKAFRMPAWAPGDYQLFNYGEMIESIDFRKKGASVQSEKGTDPNLWTLPEGADEVVYTVKPSRGNFSPNLRVRPDHFFVSPPGVLGWFEGDEKNKHRLHLSITPEGARVHSSLTKLRSAKSGFETFEAPNYDELIDAPFVVGTAVKSESFTTRGKDLSVVAFNQIANADLAGFVRVGKLAAEACHDLFGELPFPNYIFFCDFGGGGGGLEHLNSTRLGLGARSTGEGATGLIFHEFFHLYNVKRIREKPLGPFDYTKPAQVKTLWWLEGVTDYYASVLAHRVGLETRAQFLGDMSGSLMSFGRNPNRLRISAEEASLRVWEARGSYGYGGVNYYEKGRLIGICLDLAIRGQTGGKKSLDDVIRTLYEETKGDKPGYEEARIRALCIQYGGPELGRIYDVSVKQATELPIAEVAKMCGLNWSGAGFAPDPMASAEAQAIGAAWPMAIR